jgi:tRNA G18 (ribose-2'-O)-methylase SpoU
MATFCPETAMSVYVAQSQREGGQEGSGMRGYFGIGSERISKAMNLGAILRTAHAFNASFAFSIKAHHDAREVNLADTSKSVDHLPLYEWASLDEMRLPRDCVLVGVELDERAVDLPVFRHPLNAAYLLGPEKGDLSPQAKAKCAHIVKIPTRFCVNLSIAAAIVMYDRTLAMGGFPDRPVSRLQHK